MKKSWIRASVALAAAGALGLGVAGTASADPEVEQEPIRGETGKGDGYLINFSSGESSTQAQERWFQPEGSDDKLLVYCINIGTVHNTNKIYEEGAWDESNVANLELVQWVLHNGWPNVAIPDEAPEGVEPSLLDDEQTFEKILYAATQAAIWHFADGTEINRDDPTGEDAFIDEAVLAFHDHLVDNAEPMAEPSTEITIDGPESFDASGKGGPFVVDGPGTVDVTAEGGSIVDAEDEEITSLEPGDEFYVLPDEDSSEVTVSFTGTVATATGTVLLATDANVGETPGAMAAESSQKLILASQLEGEVSAELTLTLERDDTLPVTGSALTVGGISGLALLVAGGAALLFMRRRKTAAAWGEAA